VSVPSALEGELRRQLQAGVLSLPDPASGHTADRHRRLTEIGRADLRVARIAEAHTDAVSILHEAGRREAPGKLYGVWAAEDPSCDLLLVDGDGATSAYVLTGTKAFCTGATIVDRALVTVRREGIAHLLDLDVRDARVTFDNTGWRTPAFAETLTAVATFDDLEVAADDVVGAPGWYLDRVGFWHGACGPAACWAGGAIGLVDQTIECGMRKGPDPHRDAQLGALAGLRWQLLAVLDVAGREIDSDPCDVTAAMQRALMLRHTVERAATAIIDLAGRAMGPRPLIQDPEIVRRVGELQLYIRQHHDEHDLESVGRSLRDDPPADPPTNAP
jgi:alkylation response protein AidB-like acyl-CoA dehydrogenase